MLVPETYDKIMPALQKSAAAAAKSCSGNNANVCGVRWYENKYDNSPGMEQQISASDVIIGSMVQFNHAAPVTAKTGGNSTSNPDAGSKDTNVDPNARKPIKSADRVGAGFVTALILGCWVSGIGWIVLKP